MQKTGKNVDLASRLSWRVKIVFGQNRFRVIYPVKNIMNHVPSEKIFLIIQTDSQAAKMKPYKKALGNAICVAKSISYFKHQSS
ncbi:hypothetical protein AK95_05820 [Paenibacillus sp. LC231]|nr:hypothetical protein AK95_05820 [Paenibacillus sp. LC231]